MAQRLRGRLLIVLLDYDGTLVPIAATPRAARLAEPVRLLLRRLSERPSVFVALVSGRARNDLMHHVKLPELVYVGNHGLELQGPRWAFRHRKAIQHRPVLWRLARQLHARLRAIPGVCIEWKGLSFSVHWRRVPLSAQRAFHRLIAEHTAPYLLRGAIRVTSGKRVVEVRPSVRWNKGDVVLWLVRRLTRRRPYTVVYLGDDQTDEDAFRVVNRLRGYSVVVGRPPHPTAAAYQLAGPREVHRWLRMATQVLRALTVNTRRSGDGVDVGHR